MYIKKSVSNGKMIIIVRKEVTMTLHVYPLFSTFMLSFNWDLYTDLFRAGNYKKQNIKTEIA